MGAIATILAALERLLNALIEDSTAARERAAALEGKRLGIHLVAPEIEIVARIERGGLRLERESVATADTVLAGTPIALLAVWRMGRAARFEASGASVAGDATTLEAFAELLELARPDLEDVLSQLTGDIVAHEAFHLAGEARTWASRAVDALVLNTAEYLTEESRDLPSRHEVGAFYRDVERLRDDVERAVARVERVAGVEPGASSGTDGSEDGSCASSA